MNKDTIKQQFREFYSNHTTLENIAVDINSSEYYELTEKKRYSDYPYIPKLMEFDRYWCKNVLEIGLGQGIDHAQFAKYGAVMSGIDITEKHVNVTRQRLEFLGYKSDLRIGDAAALPFNDNSFDLVYSCGVLFLIPDIENVVKEIYRVLKPGGKVIALFYNRDSFNYWLNIIVRHGIINRELSYLTFDKLLDWYAGDGFGYPHVRYFNKRELGELFHVFDKREFYITTLDTLEKLGIPLMTRIFTKSVIETLSHYVGYYLTIKAVK